MFNNARLLDKEKVTGSLSRFGFVLISQLKHSQVNPSFPFAVRGVDMHNFDNGSDCQKTVSLNKDILRYEKVTFK